MTRRSSSGDPFLGDPGVDDHGLCARVRSPRQAAEFPVTVQIGSASRRMDHGTSSGPVT